MLSLYDGGSGEGGRRLLGRLRIAIAAVRALGHLRGTFQVRHSRPTTSMLHPAAWQWTNTRDVQDATLYDEGEQVMLGRGYCLALWQKSGLQLLPAVPAIRGCTTHCYWDAARSGW